MPGDERFFDATCACFDLGAMTARPVAIAGGLSNDLYHVTTDRGEFAVKRMVANAHAASFKRNVEASFAVERLAQRAGIAMPAPVPVAGSGEALGRVADGIEECWVRVHAWVNAARVDEDRIEPGDIASLGAILAILHSLPISGNGLASWPETPSMDRDWRTALNVGGDAAQATGPLTNSIDILEEIVRRGRQASRSRRVLSHRDLDAKNLLRGRRGDLIVIDWDAAGPVDAQWDAVNVAMDWSGVRQGPVSESSFEGFLDAYTLAGGKLDPIRPEHFAGWSEGVLDWLWFNLERAGSPDSAESLRGRREMEHTARFLARAATWIAK